MKWLEWNSVDIIVKVFYLSGIINLLLNTYYFGKAKFDRMKFYTYVFIYT